MLRLRAAQVGNVVKQKALHRIGDELLQLPAGALQQDFLQRADFASHINGHADRSSYQKFLSLPLILLSVSRFFSKRNSFSAAILSVLRISMQEIQQNADKFLQLPAPCFSTVFQSPVFPKKCPFRRIWERHKYSQKFFSERRRVQTAEKRYSRSFGGKSVIGTSLAKRASGTISPSCMDLLFQFPNCAYDCLKHRNITIEHVLHCFVICGQCCKAILRGNQFQSAGNSLLILCPRPRIELHFEVRHRLQQFHPGKGSLFHRCHRHAIQVIVMPGITLRHFRTLGSVRLVV